MRRAVLALLLAGCSYDWAVTGTPPADAGRDALSPADVSVADSSDAAPTDATTESMADAGPTDSFVAPDVSLAECQQLLQAAKNALPLALVCTQSIGQCQAKTQDWCGCSIYLGDGTSAAYMNFVNDVAAFVSAGCRSTENCGSCFDASAGICVLSQNDAGMYACYQ